MKQLQNQIGDFPSAPYPNPEVREAMSLGIFFTIELAEKENADLLIANRS